MSMVVEDPLDCLVEVMKPGQEMETKEQKMILVEVVVQDLKFEMTGSSMMIDGGQNPELGMALNEVVDEHDGGNNHKDDEDCGESQEGAQEW